MLALEVKLASQNVPDVPLTPAFRKDLPTCKEIGVVT